ncbi:MAG: Na+/H+ antiporter subunit E [Bacteroidales bacterium]|nr:Na+/H+ antiporter subunit E [Bacteroidales bacterium]
MKHVALFIILLGLWLLLTLNLRTANMLAGITAALVTTLFFGRYFVTGIRKFLEPMRYLWLLVFLVIFIWECLKANFDVAYRVIHPKMPIRPGIIKVKLDLKSDFAKVMLANSITMTPGTLSVDLIGDILYVHWIYVRTSDPEKYSEFITSKFEKYIKRIFD